MKHKSELSKSRRLSKCRRLLQQSDARRHLYLVLFGSVYQRRSPFYSIHALDFPDDEIGSSDKCKPLPQPVVKFGIKKYPLELSFVSLGSKIYMIGGKSNRTSDPSIDVYLYDTFTSAKKPEKIPIQLQAAKVLPILIALQGKIYVLSRSLCVDSRLNPMPHFEVLDPDTMSSTGLPSPEFPESFYISMQVRAHTVHESKIFISTRLGIYSFDVSQNQNRWTTYVDHHFLGVQRFPFMNPSVFSGGYLFAFSSEKDMYFGELRAYDFTQHDGLAIAKQVFGLRTGSAFVKYNTCSHLFALGDDRLCVIRTGLDEDDAYTPIYVTLDLCEVFKGQVLGDDNIEKLCVLNHAFARYSVEGDYKNVVSHAFLI